MSDGRRSERITRGKRFRRVLEEEQEADEEFWRQEFFREDEKDDAYLTETDQESVADSDFSNPDAETDGDDDETAEPLEKPKRKRLVAPGSEVKRARVQVKREEATKEKTVVEASPVTLRQSTLERRTAAEEGRRLQEMSRMKRAAVKVSEKAPTLGLEEFLKEVAETEVANLASLNELEAVEEESKKRALQTRTKKKVPSVTIRSSRNGDAEKTVMELTNARRFPEWLRRQEKPKEPEPQKCVMTGLPAKYRDPLTKLPYATVEAFHAIRQRYVTQMREWTQLQQQQQEQTRQG